MITIEQTQQIAFSQAEFDKIKAEELLRIKIKNELEPKEKKSKGWVFLNSPLGLLIISALLVTGFGNYLTRQFQEKDNYNLLRKEAVKHFIELDYRISQVEIFLKGIDENPKDAYGRGYYMNRLILADKEQEFQPAINDYRKMSMLELLSWFKFNYNIKNEKDSELAYNTLKTLNSLQKDGIWDTKKMRVAMKICKKFLDSLQKDILK